MKRTRKEDAMPTSESIAIAQGYSLRRAQGSFRSCAAGVAEWLRACGDYYAAAALYEQLNQLSDAELHRRSLNRSTLARSIFESVEHKGRF
jgi:hypothetical protein